MFNLIVRSVLWDDGAETMSIGRVLEFTEDALRDQFSNEEGPDFDQLVQLPCLFMQEGTGDELAYVGQIARARTVNGEVIFECTLDRNIPPIQNRLLHERRILIDIANDFEFHRNHWAVKDVDLYRFVVRYVQQARQRPTVFRIEEHERIEPTLVSAMMPFDAAFDEVYQSISTAVANTGLNCRRADEFWENPEVMQDIATLIDRSHIVICDCSGRNPNVFYEAGIAHTLGREVILIAQNPQDVPFDLRHLRFISYLNNTEGRVALTEALEERLETIVGH